MSSFTDGTISRQVIFFSTGSVAGVCSATADYSFDRVSASIRSVPSRPFSSFTSSLLPHVLRPGIRFWGFDLAKTLLVTENLPVGLRGGIAGAAGGFGEMLASNVHSFLTSARQPTIGTAARTTLLHSCKLFLCFGSYTYLANKYSDQLPPKPFGYCLLLGALAGAFGTTLITPLDMYSGAPGAFTWRQTAKTAIARAPRGAVGVGTVIAVQVTTSAWLLGQT